MISVTKSMLPDGAVKAPKTEAGARTVPLLPALRRELLAWKIKSPCTRPRDYVICTADGEPVQERNMRRALESAKAAAKLDKRDDRLSWHSLRHSFASLLATDLELPATTLAAVVGHADAGFTLRVYARDARDPGSSSRTCSHGRKAPASGGSRPCQESSAASVLDEVWG